MAADEDAIRQLPAAAWKPGITQDGTAEDDKDVAEITGLTARAGNWPDGLRWIARRVKPPRRHLRNLAGTHLTSTSSPCDRKEDYPGAVGAGAHPGAPGVPRTTRPRTNRHEVEKQTPARSVTRPQAT